MKAQFWIKMAFLSLLLLAIVTAYSAAPGGATHPRLYCGTDSSGFAGMNGQLAVAITHGALAGGLKTFNLNYPLNGITSAPGYLLAGQPENVGSTAGNTLRKILATDPPTLVSTILPGSNSFSATCCNEQMVPEGDGTFYHAHWSDSIQQISIASGQSQVLRTFPQSNVVGMATDGSRIWISNWSGQQVGTWNPGTNIFTPVFTTPSAAGALAWDVANGVLWVGMSDGSVIPYNSTGQQLGSGFIPFGGNNVDGLAFVPQ